jgi:hypothetical protein
LLVVLLNALCTENHAKICENDHQHHHLPWFFHTICNNGLNIECVLMQNYI